MCQKSESITSHHDEQMNQIASLDIIDLDLVDSVLQVLGNFYFLNNLYFNFSLY